MLEGQIVINTHTVPSPILFQPSSFFTVVNFLDMSCEPQSTRDQAPIQK